MNLKEHVLEELELHEYYVRDALQCLLHTILFVRAPGSLRPRESHCENFGLSFARCGARDVDVAVDRALEDFWRSLRPAGPDLSKGWIAVSFFMRREKKSFGLFLKEEKVVWEQWVVPVLVNTSPRPTEADDTSVLARGRLQEMAVRLVQGRMLDILTSVNDCIDHVPPVGTEYEFEVKEMAVFSLNVREALSGEGDDDQSASIVKPPSVTEGGLTMEALWSSPSSQDRILYTMMSAPKEDRRESVYARLMQAPSPLNL